MRDYLKVLGGCVTLLLFRFCKRVSQSLTITMHALLLGSFESPSSFRDADHGICKKKYFWLSSFISKQSFFDIFTLNILLISGTSKVEVFSLYHPSFASSAGTEN